MLLGEDAGAVSHEGAEGLVHEGGHVVVQALRLGAEGGLTGSLKHLLEVGFDAVLVADEAAAHGLVGALLLLAALGFGGGFAQFALLKSLLVEAASRGLVAKRLLFVLVFLSFALFFVVLLLLLLFLIIFKCSFAGLTLCVVGGGRSWSDWSRLDDGSERRVEDGVEFLQVLVALLDLLGVLRAWDVLGLLHELLTISQSRADLLHDHFLLLLRALTDLGQFALLLMDPLILRGEELVRGSVLHLFDVR